MVLEKILGLLHHDPKELLRWLQEVSLHPVDILETQCQHFTRLDTLDREVAPIMELKPISGELEVTVLLLHDVMHRGNLVHH